MSQPRRIIHAESGRTLVEAARWCDSFASKLRGFTFRSALEPGEGLVLVDKGDSKMNAAIHMLFVPFDLGVIWVNDAGVIVDTVLAKPWRLSYTPQAAARYVIETEPAKLGDIQIGEHIRFEMVP